MASPPLPLTTTFTPASSCLVDLYQVDNTEGVYCGVGITTYLCQYLQLGPTSTSACLPSGWNTGSTAYFSPGICPSGYRQACSSTVNIGTLVETRATCCPSGYFCQTRTDWPWYSTDACTYVNTNPVPYTYTTTDNKGDYVTSTTTNVEGFNAYGVSIRYQATDFASAQKTSSSVPSTSSSSSSSRSAPTLETSSSSASNGLPTGAKVGVGVGCSVGVLLLILVGFLIFRLRSYTRSVTVQHEESSDLVQTTEYAKSHPHSELQGWVTQKAVELPVPPAELPASGPRRW
ncbi:hypothetical protein DTO271G3_965 [Paecilomyces variotii]|nr:hypothetical protein DTO271G3_965 [Paecilomyces variotii]